MVPWETLLIDLCFLWEKPKDLNGASEWLVEWVCEEVYVVVILVGGSSNWFSYHDGCLSQ